MMTKTMVLNCGPQPQYKGFWSVHNGITTAFYHNKDLRDNNNHYL